MPALQVYFNESDLRRLIGMAELRAMPATALVGNLVRAALERENQNRRVRELWGQLGLMK